MPKSKRFQNPLKSAHPPSQTHSSPQTQCPTHPTTQVPVRSLPQTRCAGHPPTQAPPRSSPQTQSATHPPSQTHSSPQTQCATHPPTQAPVHSLPQTQCAGHTPTQAPPRSSPQTQSASQAATHPSPVPNTRESSPLVEDSLDDALNDTTPADSPSTETSQQSQSTRQYVGRESTQHWTVEAIDPREAIEKIKVKVKEVNNLPRGQRIIVDFDGQGAPYGEAQGLLAGYCGTLATDCKLFPISFDKWSGPAGCASAYFRDCYETDIKPRFCFRTTEAIAQRYCKLSIGKKWAASRQKLWWEFYDPTKTRDEITSNVPTGIEKDQWIQFVNYRLKPQTLEICQKNKQIRSKQLIPHTGGSKPLSRKRREMFLETGKQPSRGQLYIETHKKKDGSVVNDTAKAIMEQIEVGLTQSSNDESEVSPNDVVGRVLGPEHHGRVRSMGMGAAPTNTFRNTRLRLSDLSLSSSDVATSSSNFWQEKYTDLQSQVQSAMGALKAYMIMKEGRIPEELLGFFGSSNPTDAASGPNSPLDVRGSSGASNV